MFKSVQDHEEFFMVPSWTGHVSMSVCLYTRKEVTHMTEILVAFAVGFIAVSGILGLAFLSYYLISE